MARLIQVPALTLILCTSHVRVVRCPSDRWTSLASNAWRKRPRVAAPIASVRSITRRYKATSLSGSCKGSMQKVGIRLITR
jgi:hypothetical protein